MGFFKLKVEKNDVKKEQSGPAVSNASGAPGCRPDVIPAKNSIPELDFLNNQKKSSLFPYIDGMMSIDQVELQDSIKAIAKELVSLSEEQENLVGDADGIIKELDDKIVKMEDVAKQYERLAVFIDRKYVSINFARKEFSIIRSYHMKNQERYKNLPKEMAEVEKEETEEDNGKKSDDAPQRPKFNR